MEIKELGDVMAVRELSLSEGSTDQRAILVKLGMPRQFPDSSCYFVPFQITGIGTEKVRYVAGVDAFQALQLVMTTIGFYLNKLNYDVGGGLRWEGGDTGNLGFPSQSVRD